MVFRMLVKIVIQIYYFSVFDSKQVMLLKTSNARIDMTTVKAASISMSHFSKTCPRSQQRNTVFERFTAVNLSLLSGMDMVKPIPVEYILILKVNWFIIIILICTWFFDDILQ